MRVLRQNEILASKVVVTSIEPFIMYPLYGHVFVYIHCFYFIYSIIIQFINGFVIGFDQNNKIVDQIIV